MRKRLVLETLHLDVEGGIGERRTTPATAATALDEGVSQEKNIDKVPKAVTKVSASATVEVQLEALPPPSEGTTVDDKGMVVKKPAKVRKKVAFQSDKPELYDF